MKFVSLRYYLKELTETNWKNMMIKNFGGLHGASRICIEHILSNQALHCNEGRQVYVELGSKRFP